MSVSEKKKWIALFYSTILYASLSYIKELLLFYDIGLAHILPSVILYGGIVYSVIILGISYYLRKKYETPNAVILRDRQVLIPFILMIIAGIGIHIMRFINS